MPGGESTTMLKLFALEGMGTAIQEFAAQGKPIFGTCAGAILLAKEVSNPPQEKLGLIDIAIERNAYGRQIDSSVQAGECPELADHPVEMVFIRAPSSAAWESECGCWAAAGTCPSWWSREISWRERFILN